MISPMNKRTAYFVLLIMLLIPLVYSTLLIIDTQGEFGAGTYTNSHYNTTAGALQLNFSSNNGVYVSNVLDAGNLSQWVNISWIEAVPYFKELPDLGVSETVLGGANMTGIRLLLHLNNDSSIGENDLTVVDRSGNGYDATVEGSPTWIPNTPINGGWDLPGGNVNDFIDIDYRAADNLNDLTTVFWARADSGSRGAIISGANSGQNNEFLFFMSNVQMSIYLNGPSDTWTINANDGEWHHYAFTRTGTTGELFEDGRSLGTLSVSNGQIDLDSGGFMLGQEQDSVGGGFAASQAYNGGVDELAIWDRVLSDQEIRDIYERGAMKLNVSVRSCDDASCVGENWEQTFTNADNNMSIANNTYFQYMVNMSTFNNTFVTRLYNLTIGFERLDVVQPNIGLVSPVNNTVNTSSNLPQFEFNVTDNNATSLSCSLWMNETIGGTASIRATNTSTVANVITTIIPSAPLNDDVYYWWMNCSDGRNSNVSETRIINISLGDMIAPQVTLIAPANNTQNTTNATPRFDYNSTDNLATNLACGLWINNTIGGTPTLYGERTAAVNVTQSIVANATLTNGNYTWWVNCSDGNNFNTSLIRNIEIFVDRLTPNITLYVPSDDNSSIDFSSVSYICGGFDDVGVNNISLYSNHTGSWVINSTQNVNGIDVNATFVLALNKSNYFEDKSFEWACDLYDTAGKYNISDSNFTYSNWDLGNRTNLDLDVSGAHSVDLYGTNTSGYYISAIKDGLNNRSWDNFTISTGTPLGIDLPDSKVVEANGANMTGNVLLLHMDESPISNGGTFSDTSGEGHVVALVTNNGATDKSITDGVYENATNFDGAGDYALANTVMADIAGDDFTVMAWARSSTNSGQQFVIGINTVGGGNKLLFGHRSGNSALSLYDTSTWQDTGTTIVDGEWHLVGYVFEDSTNNVAIYVDGSNVLNYSSSASALATDTFAIGMEYDSATPGDYWNGDIDEVAVWNRSLGGNEINDMYLRGSAKLNISARSCDDAACSGDSWEETFTDPVRNLTVDDQRYFQYMVNVSTRVAGSSPSFDEIIIGHSVGANNTPRVNATPANNSITRSGIINSTLTSDLDLVYVGYYLDGNSSAIVNMTMENNRSWYSLLQNLTFGDHNITFLYNKSTRGYELVHYFTYSRDRNMTVRKNVNATSTTDLYWVNLTVINHVNLSENVTVVDFVPSGFTPGSFSPFYDFTNTTTGTYNGAYYGWNLTVTPLSKTLISYAITGTGDYELLREFVVGID